MPIHPVPTPEQIVERYSAGTLAEELGRSHRNEKGDDELFVRQCVELHNAGSIDVLAVVHQPAFASLEASAFFTAQHMYVNLIPKLNADPVAVMGCVAHLIDRAGQDLSAYLPERALLQWCQRLPTSAARIVELAHVDQPLAIRFAGVALIAMGSAPEAQAFISTYTDARRDCAVGALGRIPHDVASAQQALTTLRVLLNSPEDRLRARALTASFDVLAQQAGAGQGQDIVITATHGAGPHTLYALAALLAEQHASLGVEGTKRALAAMVEVDAQHRGTLNMLDAALRGLLGGAHEAVALDSLTDLLATGKWPAEEFSSTVHELAHGPAQRCHDLIVRWLIGDSNALGHAAAHIAHRFPERPFDPTLSTAGLDDAGRLRLGSRAIGFLFVHHVGCCEVLLSAMRGASEATQKSLADVLFDPLLVSYPSTRDRLAQVGEADALHAVIQEVLARFDEYQRALHAVPNVAELRPSERQRYTWSRLQGEQMRQSMKQAEGKSLVRQMVRTAHLLHGRQSLTMVHDPQIGSRVVSMELNEMRHSMEMPALEWWDPVGLSYAVFAGRQGQS